MKLLYLAPAALLLIGVIAFPLGASLPAGITHIPLIFGDETFRQVSLNTLLFAIISVSLELVLGLLFALAIHQSFRLRGITRAIVLLPWALPTAVMAMSWRWIFNDTYGIANDLPMRLGFLNQSIAWLARPTTAFTSLVVADVWKTTPFVTILLLAGLQAIPRDLHEAMAIDGAGRIRRFFWITLPLLRPAIALSITFRLIHTLGIFDLVWVLTGGGPANATKTVAVYIYDIFFRFGEVAYGAAVTIFVATVMFLLTIATNALLRGKVRS